MAYVYRFKHYRSNKIIYIGKTKRKLSKRMNEHFVSKPHLPNECYDKVGRIEYIEVGSDSNSYLIEQYLINKHKPKYNTQGKSKDDYTIISKLMGSLMSFKRWRLYEIRRKSMFNINFVSNYIRHRYEKFDKTSDFLFDMLFHSVVFYFLFVICINYIK